MQTQNELGKKSELKQNKNSGGKKSLLQYVKVKL